MKIIGIGFNKTGTTTLHRCCKQFGFKHKTFSPTMCHHYFNKNYDAIYRVLDRLDSVEDWPWLLMYKELDQRYPDAKFVLTLRRDSESWWRSLEKHISRTVEPVPGLRKQLYGYENPLIYKDEMIRRYEEHNDKVLKYFNNKPDKLLTVCWENGDGWSELCGFLDLDIPNIDFPHANKRPNPTVKRYILSLLPNKLKIVIKRILRSGR